MSIRRILVAATVLAATVSLAACDPVEALHHPEKLLGHTQSASEVLSPTIDRERTMAMLDAIPVKGRAPKTGYTRSQFGAAWTDDNTTSSGGNGCDTRDDILARDLTDVTFKDGRKKCQVKSGNLLDPYTGKTIHFVRGPKTSTAVQIDHVVPLSNAWQTGAQQLTDGERVNLANDPINLLAVDGPANMQKSDGDAATWLPPNKGFRCAYVARQTLVKSTYHLWMTQAEKTAIHAILVHC